MSSYWWGQKPMMSNSPEIKNDNINPINNGILYSCWGSAQHYGTTTGGLQVWHTNTHTQAQVCLLIPWPEQIFRMGGKKRDLASSIHPNTSHLSTFKDFWQIPKAWIWEEASLHGLAMKLLQYSTLWESQATASQWDTVACFSCPGERRVNNGHLYSCPWGWGCPRGSLCIGFHGSAKVWVPTI